MKMKITTMIATVLSVAIVSSAIVAISYHDVIRDEVNGQPVATCKAMLPECFPDGVMPSLQNL